MKRVIFTLIFAGIAALASAQCPNIVTATCGPDCDDVGNYLNTNYGSCGPFLIHKIVWDCDENKGIITISSQTYNQYSFVMGRGRSGQLYLIGDPCC